MGIVDAADRKGQGAGHARRAAPLISVMPRAFAHPARNASDTLSRPRTPLHVYRTARLTVRFRPNYRSALLVTPRMPAKASHDPRSRSRSPSRFPPALRSLYALRRFVEDTYKLEFGAAQTTQLSRAITTGAEKGHFVLPKGRFPAVKGNAFLL